ncbi:hypothetical protein N566_17285 [Streptomycetaceae bacterium MP113-05]|nr:hypothetical protein N566_17285 [Streptomycetaceae bacterium MP113-05]
MGTSPDAEPFTDVHDHLLDLAAGADLLSNGIPGGSGLLLGGFRIASGRASLQRTLIGLRGWSAGYLRDAAGSPGPGSEPESVWCDLAGISLRLALQLAEESDSLTRSSRGPIARSMVTAAYRRFWSESADPATGEREDYTQALNRVFDEESLRFMGRHTLPAYRRLATGAFAAAQTEGGAGAQQAETATLRYVPARLAQVGSIEVPTEHTHAGMLLGHLVADRHWAAAMAAAGAPDRGGHGLTRIGRRELDAVLGLPPRQY